MENVDSIGFALCAVDPSHRRPAAAGDQRKDEKKFADAVLAALRSLTRHDRLRDNPLLRCRLVTARAGTAAPDGQRMQALQEMLVEAARLTGTSVDRRLARVLHRA